MKQKLRISRLSISCFAAGIALLLIQTNLSAQQFSVESIPSINTLSANSVYALLRDKEGFLWVGTQNGLNRYDGRQFKYFVHDNKDTTTLSDNFIVSLSEDSTGNIWVGTRHGLNRFDKRTQTFQRFYLMDFADNATHQTVYSLACALDGTMYAVADGRLYTLSAEDPRSVQRVVDIDSVMSITFDPYGALVMGFMGTIEVTARSGPSNQYHFQSSAQINTVLAEQHRIFVGSNDGVWIIEKDLTDGKKTKHIFKNTPVNSLSVDGDGQLWIGTDKGIYVYDGAEPVHQIAERSTGSPKTKMSSIRSLHFDRSGILWFGMLRNGIAKVDPLKKVFHTIDERILGNDGVVWSVLQDTSKKHWFGTQRGVYQFGVHDDQFRNPAAWKQRLFGNTMISSLLEDSRGVIWVGSRPGGLYRFSPLDNTLRHFLHNDHDSLSLIHNNVSSVFECDDGKLWVTTAGGLCTYDPVTRNFTRVRMMESDGKKEVTYFLHVMEDRNHTLWIASSSGLFSYDHRSGQYSLYYSNSNDTTSLSYNIVASTMEDRKGRLWIATLGGGINLFDRGTKRFTRYTTVQGLVNDVVYGIMEDKLGRLWMSTDFGLSCFDPESNAFSSFGKENGLEFLEFSQNSFYKNSFGTMFFGGIGGAVMFQPESVKTMPRQNSIAVSDIRINYASISPRDPAITVGTITAPQEIHITHEQQALSFDFISLDFRFQEQTSYAYRLKGFYDHWVYPADQQRTAHYTHLPPGEYSFEVRSSVQKGEWSGKGLQIRIVVHPPFWRTWWFILFSALTILGLFFSGVRYISQRKLKQQLREIELQHKVTAERERISRDLHDSTGSNIAGIISGLNLAERYLETSKPKTKKTLQLLTKEARAGMTQLRETILALKTVEMSMDDFCDSVCEAVSKQLQFRKKIFFQLIRNYPAGVQLSSIQGLHLMRIIEEALTNALNHSAAKQIEVRIEYREDQLSVQVRNDGKRKKHRNIPLLHGNGIPNMKRRAEEIGARFLFECDELNGSVMTVSLPFQRG